MALSKQWRRITVIFVCWSSCVRQINNQRHGMMILTSRRFWAIMRRFLGVWCTFSKHLRRKEVLLSISLSQRWRRVLLKVLKVLKRMVFESRAARELYGLGALDDTTSSPVQVCLLTLFLVLRCGNARQLNCEKYRRTHRRKRYPGALRARD
jgi:hypothetical protein